MTPVATPTKRSFPYLRGSAQQNQAIKNIATLISDALDAATARLRSAGGLKAPQVTITLSKTPTLTLLFDSTTAQNVP